MNTIEGKYHKREKEMARLKVVERLVEGEIKIKEEASILILSTRQKCLEGYFEAVRQIIKGPGIPYLLIRKGIPYILA
ncbi:MAG: hypothetical protein PHG41_04820 [Actinomycetota bacterium]|nr:hypothetical protein [Actinomycetota bacterium]